MMRIITLGIVIFISLTAYSKPVEKVIYKDSSYPVEKRVDDLLNRMTLDEKIAQISHLHLPLMRIRS